MPGSRVIAPVFCASTLHHPCPRDILISCPVDMPFLCSFSSFIASLGLVTYVFRIVLYCGLVCIQSEDPGFVILPGWVMPRSCICAEICMQGAGNPIAQLL